MNAFGMIGQMLPVIIALAFYALLFASPVIILIIWIYRKYKLKKKKSRHGNR